MGVQNVLLIAMSVFNPALMENTYEYKDEQGNCYSVTGISQLEPGTKCMIEMLKKENQHLDKIVVMNTNATRKEEKVKLLGEEVRSISPYEFYKERIQAFIGKIYGAIEFVDINIEDESRKEAFFLDVAKEISKDAQKTKVHLYMDMQGGDRNTAFYMNSIAELLKNQNVEIKKRIAIRFTPRVTDEYVQREGCAVHQMEEVSEKYQSYELLTAMKVFKEYGWGNELVDFFRDSKNEADNELVEVIKEASEAIQTCKVQNFDMAVKKIKTLIDKYKNSDEVSAHMQIIIKEIEEDYGVLLKDDTRLRYVEQIRWCLRKGFVQQAISILEAKMPHEYVVSGLQYYCRKNDNPVDILNKFKVVYDVLNANDVNRLYIMKDINHFFIRDLNSVRRKYQADLGGIQFIKYSDYTFVRNRSESERRKNELRVNINAYRELCNKRNDVAHVATMVDINKAHSFVNQIYGRTSHPEQNLVQEIEKYIADFERMANCIANPNSVDLE